MDISSAFSASSWLSQDFLNNLTTMCYMTSIVAFVFTILTFQVLTKPKTNAPLVNPSKFFEVGSLRRRLQFVLGAREILSDAWKEFPNKCFRIMTEFDEVVILPAEYANNIRNDTRFSFFEFTKLVRRLPKPRSSRIRLD